MDENKKSMENGNNEPIENENEKPAENENENSAENNEPIENEIENPEEIEDDKPEEPVNNNESQENSEADFSLNKEANEAYAAPVVDNESVNYSASGENEVVTVQDEQGKNKKLPIIIIAVVIAAIVICAIVYFVAIKGKDDKTTIGKTETTTEETSRIYTDADFYENVTDADGQVVPKEEYISQLNQQLQEATTTLSGNVGVTSPNVIVEDTTAKITEGMTASNATNAKSAEAQIKAFFNRSCYLKGALYTSNEGSPMSLAFDGDDFEILTNLDNVEVSILRLDDTLYIKRPALKQYVELTDTVMSVTGISADDFNIDFGSAEYSDKNLAATYDVKINNQNGICTEYKTSEGMSKFYSVDGELVQINICDANGNVDTQLLISYFSETIPGDQLTLKGYDKSSIGAMLADMM